MSDFIGCYDREGNRIGIEQAEKLLAGERHVGLTEVGDYLVSTVFLVLDHGYGEGPPVLWETMVFPGGVDCRRYTSEADALRGHEETVLLIRATESSHTPDSEDAKP